jgi:hypothetical protein
MKLPDFLTPINSISDSLKKMTTADTDATPPQLDHHEEAR